MTKRRNRKSTTPFRVIGGDGAWAAWCTERKLYGFTSNTQWLDVPIGKGRFREELCAVGRTPGEALERCKKAIGWGEYAQYGR